MLHDFDKELNQLVSIRIRKERRNIKPNISERMADKVAEFGGSWKFIFISSGIFILWVLINTYIPALAFDKKPFILLNLVLSFLAIFQAPFILMSQSRISDIDRSRDEKEYRLNIKTELEIKALHEKMDKLIAEYQKSIR